jgi:D-alanine-D-alanine ligase
VTARSAIHGRRVAVLYNAPVLPSDHPDAESERGVVDVARAVVKALKSQGARAWMLAARGPVNRLVKRLNSQKPEVVFNLIEGFGGNSAGEAWVTALLELLRIPYTGCPPESQGLCRHKARTKALLAGFGLPTAPFAVVRSGEPLPRLPFPLFVKPESEDASLGIDQGSVIRDERALQERIDMLCGRYGSALVEHYLPGREFNVGVIGRTDAIALPIAEVVYKTDARSWPILTYDAKWSPGSAADAQSPVQCPATVGDDLANALRELAVRAFRTVGCRDAARVDFRLDSAGNPMILEVNPNPDLDPKAGWARALKASGRDYAGTIAGFVVAAIERINEHG